MVRLSNPDISVTVSYPSPHTSFHQLPILACGLLGKDSAPWAMAMGAQLSSCAQLSPGQMYLLPLCHIWDREAGSKYTMAILLSSDSPTSYYFLWGGESGS